MDGPIASCGRSDAKRNLHRLALPSCLLLLIALLSACTAAVATPPPPFDDFNRANGALGPNWTATTDGGMAISSQALVGTNAGNSGSIRTAETYSANQSSQLQITAPQMTGSQFIGVAVRAQNGGRTLYLGTYSWNNGSPQLRLYKRINGTFTQLAAFASGVLAANTTLRLSVSGSQLTVSQNGT